MARQHKAAERARIEDYFNQDAVKSMFGDEMPGCDAIGPPPPLQNEGLSKEDRRRAVNDAFDWIKRQMLQIRLEDQAFLKHLLRMRKTITKIKEEDEEWKQWEAQCEQGDYTPDKGLGRYKRSSAKIDVLAEEVGRHTGTTDVLAEEVGRHRGTTAHTSSAKAELQAGSITATKNRTLPAPGRQYRQAFIPTPPLMSPTSPSSSLSSGMISDSMTLNNSDSIVNDSSLMRDHSFQSVSPQKDTPSPKKQPTRTRAQSTPKSQLPLPPPLSPPIEMGQSSRPKYGPVMRRTWSMDNVSAPDQYQSTSSIDSGVGMMRMRGSDFSSKERPHRRSSTSSLSSEVFTDGEYKSRSESPVSSDPAASSCVIPTVVVTPDSEIQGQQRGRSVEFRHSASETNVPDKIWNRHSTGQKLATILDESPSEKRMMKDWSEAEGNVRFVLDRRTQRKMARQDMISSEPTSPTSPSSPKPPPKPPKPSRMPLHHSSPKPTVPSNQQRRTPPPKSLTLQHHAFHSPQVHRKCRTIGGGSISPYELYRAASENALSSFDDHANYEAPVLRSTLQPDYIHHLSMQKGHTGKAKLDKTAVSPSPIAYSPSLRRGRGSFPQVRYSAESPITDL